MELLILLCLVVTLLTIVSAVFLIVLRWFAIQASMNFDNLEYIDSDEDA